MYLIETYWRRDRYDGRGRRGWRPSVMQRLLQGVENEVGVRRPARSPADDAAGRYASMTKAT